MYQRTADSSHTGDENRPARIPIGQAVPPSRSRHRDRDSKAVLPPPQPQTLPFIPSPLSLQAAAFENTVSSEVHPTMTRLPSQSYFIDTFNAQPAAISSFSRAANPERAHPGSHYTTTIPLPVTSPPQDYRMMNHNKPAHKYIPLPLETPDRPLILLNPLLQYTSNNTPPGVGIVDLSQPPSILLNNQGIRILGQAATSPPLLSLTITSCYLPWPIVVQRSNINPSCVTIADVFGTLYGNLQLPVSDLQSDGGNQLRLYGVNNPTSRWEGAIGEQWNAGRRYPGSFPQRKRLDYLQGQHTFLGLSKSSRGDDVWELHVC